MSRNVIFVLITLLVLLEYLSCAGDTGDSFYVRRIQEESQFSFLMNMKDSGGYFLYKRRGCSLSQGRGEEFLPIRISSPVRSDL
jgi:hypothetical protein